jgi:glycosyltransferase involved in cell wall biosynthesis
VNDGSTDDTKARLAALDDPRLRVFDRPNGGVSPARNFGARAAEGAYLYFLDGDDVLLPDGLGALMAALDREGTACAYGLIGRMHENGTPMPDKPVLRRPEGFVLETLLKRNFILACAALVRRDDFFRAGLFDETLRMGEDWEFWCRLALRGDFRPVRTKTLNYRIRAGSASARGICQLQAATATTEKLFGNPRIRERLGAAKMGRLRGKSEAHIIANLAIREIANGNLRAFMRLARRSILTDYTGAPALVARAVLALAGRQ